MKHKWRLVVGVLVFVLMSVNWAVIHFTDERRPGSYDGWTARLSPESGAVIVNVDPTGPASALQIGDELWRVDGVPVNDANPAVLNFNRTVPPGTRYPVQLRRNGQLIELTLQTVPYAQRAWSFSRVWIVLVYLLFLLTGAFIFLLRSDDRQAWLLALLLWTMTGLTGNNIVSGLPGWIFFTLLLARTVALWFMPLSLHFFLIFPQPVPWLRRFAQWERWLYAPFYLILLPSFGLGQLPAGLLGPTLAALFRSERFMDLDLGLVVAYLVGGLLALVSNYRAAERMARQRLRVILVGSGLGVLNLLLMPLGEWMGWQTRFPQLWAWLATALLFTLPLVPLSFAYAIIRHKVIPISLLLRRGVRYLLVSRGSTVMVMVGLSFVMFFVMDTFFRYLRPTSGRVIGVISAITAIVFWRLTNAFHQRIVAPVIDRHFFRQAYDSQQILTELAESLRTTTDIPTLLESVADKLQSALQTASVAIFLRDEKTGAYHNTYACEYNATSGRAAKCEIGNEQGGRLPQCAATLAQLAETGNTLELDGSEPAFDLANTGVTSQLTAEERQTLFDAKAALLLPLKTKNDMPGVIALGSRLGDLPFSGEDKRLLQSVAASAALALENAQLVERMLADARVNSNMSILTTTS